MQSYNIQEYKLTKNYTVDRVDVRVVELILHKSVTVMVTLFQTDIPVDVKTFKFEGDEYDNWGSSDSYLIDLILSKLNMTIKTIS